MTSITKTRYIVTCDRLPVLTFPSRAEVLRWLKTFARACPDMGGLDLVEETQVIKIKGA